MEKTPLKFKPISEGLGFHPFSDGLPYAPLGHTSHSSPSPAHTHKPSLKADYSRGSGAVSAGPATFVTPTPYVPAPTLLHTPIQPRAVYTREPAPRLQNIQPEVLAQLQQATQNDFGFTYVVARTMAFLTDLAINTIICVGALSWVLMKQNIQPEMLLSPGIIALASVFFLVFNWSLITAQEIAFATTLGKRLFGLSLEGSVGATVLRAFLFIPSTLFCGLGLLWCVFDSQNRCWHDLVTHLQPERIPSKKT